MNTDIATPPTAAPAGGVDNAIDLVEALRARAPRLGSLRVDALKIGEQVAYLDKMPKRLRVSLIGDPAPPADEIRLFLGLKTPEAEEIYGLIKRLAAVNPAGCWLLQDGNPHRLPPVTHESFHGGAASGSLNAVFREMAEDLRDIARIEVDEVAQGTQAGYSRRRVFLRVIDIRGAQVAAFDTAMFTPVIRVLAGIQDGASRVNLERGKVWAAQLGVPLGELALLLQDLSLLTVLIPSPALKFRD